jgi:microcystin-dependent protein
MHPGQGPGLSLHDLGETGGSETVTLLESEIPSHPHTARAVGGDPGDLQAPSPTRAIARSGNGFGYVAGPANAPMAQATLPPAGGDQPHNNMQPYLTFFFNIALQGVFPPRG